MEEHCSGPLNGLPERLHIDLPHFKQRSNWDCGVSCVLMVLPFKKRLEFIDNFNHICKEEGFNKSTWTIDLCYLLRRFDVHHKFYTITLGIHPGYRGHEFYTNVLTKDENRVNKRFQHADQHGIIIRKSRINLKQLLCHMLNGPIILLTNSKLLSCLSCKVNKFSTELKRCLPWKESFQGHYIVLCGYDLKYKRVYYRNPTYQNRICVMTFETLESARKSYGTDEDIIFIYN